MGLDIFDVMSIFLLALVLAQSIAIGYLVTRPYITPEMYDITNNFYENNRVTDLPFEYDTWGNVAGTGSMLPCIQNDTKVFYVTEFNLTEGDIYVYNKLNSTGRIIHRLISVFGDQCFFKGDHNNVADGWINCSQVVLKVRGLEYPD